MTPATGHVDLLRCVRSVQRQSGVAGGALSHLVFVDGPRERANLQILKAEERNHPIDVIQVPEITGRIPKLSTPCLSKP